MSEAFPTVPTRALHDSVQVTRIDGSTVFVPKWKAEHAVDMATLDTPWFSQALAAAVKDGRVPTREEWVQFAAHALGRSSEEAA